LPGFVVGNKSNALKQESRKTVQNTLDSSMQKHEIKCNKK
jgi:hypothetical protein